MRWLRDVNMWRSGVTVTSLSDLLIICFQLSYQFINGYEVMTSCTDVNKCEQKNLFHLFGWKSNGGDNKGEQESRKGKCGKSLPKRGSNCWCKIILDGWWLQKTIDDSSKRKWLEQTMGDARKGRLISGDKWSFQETVGDLIRNSGSY